MTMAVQRLFLQTIIAVIWDFDQTLTPRYMQQPLLDEYGVKADQFWEEVNALPKLYSERSVTVSKDTAYLNHILTYVKHGIFKGLTNKKLRELGGKIELYPGLPEFLEKVKGIVADEPKFAQQGIQVEHYIVSTGIKAMIEGSVVFPHVEGVWACDFIEEVIPPGSKSQMKMKENVEEPITQIGYMLDNTTKTRAIFEINKGTNKYARIDVNASITREQRRVPFHNMIYIADGPSDIPCFSVINQYGGKTFAVWNKASKDSFSQVVKLGEQDRVQAYGEADYRDGTQTYLWITHAVASIAEQIIRDRATALSQIVQPPPNHISLSQSGNLSGNGAGLPNGIRELSSG